MASGVAVTAQALGDEQRTQLRAVVLDLAESHGLDGWGIGDVAEKAGISKRTLDEHYPSKEYLLLDAMIDKASQAMAPPAERTVARGRTPRSRVLRTLSTFTEMLVASPSSSRAMVRALTSGQDAVLPMLRSFNDSMHMVVARALAGGEPGDPQWAAAEVVQQVWFAALVSWTSNVTGPEHIDESVVLALRVIGVNG